MGVSRWIRLMAAVAIACAGAGACCGQNAAGGGEGQRPGFAQPEGRTAAMSVNARLVNVPVVVRNKKGALVQDLTRSDFALQVDGKAQEIRYFDRDTDLPLALGLLVDTSASQAKALDEERRASGAFLETMLTPGRDKAFVIQFAQQVELLQDLTDARAKLQAALKAIDVEPASGEQDTQDQSQGGSRQRPRFGGRAGTTLYDAVFLAADELMAKQTGRKALVVLSDGDDRGSKETLTKAIEAAQRADVVVYAIYFKGSSPADHSQRPMGGGRRGGGGMGWPGGGRGGGYPGGGYPGGGGQGGEFRVDGKKVLQRMADETGGRLFEMTRKQTAEEIYKQIGEELRSQYRLAFTPDAETASDGYHQIELSVKRADGKQLSLQARDGYYAGK